MNLSPDDIKDRLEALAQGLEQLRFPESTVNVEHAHWLAAAIRDYLAGTSNTMDHALGLTRKRGGQVDERRNELIATVWACDPTASFREVAERVAAAYPNTFTTAVDEKQIRRAIGKPSEMELTQFAVRALAQSIANRLSARDR